MTSVKNPACHCCETEIPGFVFIWPTGGGHCFVCKDHCLSHVPIIGDWGGEPDEHKPCPIPTADRWRAWAVDYMPRPEE